LWLATTSFAGIRVTGATWLPLEPAVYIDYQ